MGVEVLNTISLKNITKSFNGKVIINDLNAELPQGKIICIYGQSGCGKTTLLNILGLLDNKYDGEVNIFGEKVIKKDRYTTPMRRKKISFIFQNYFLIPELTVLENIYVPNIYRDNSIDESKVLQILEMLQIKDIKDQKCYSLSGGEKQRVAIARAIQCDTPIIICDEPTGNLDNENRNIILNCFKDLCEHGKTLIIVTHDIKMKEVCDIVFELKGGKLYEV